MPRSRPARASVRKEGPLFSKRRVGHASAAAASARPRPCAARKRRASSASAAGISPEMRPPNRTIARSQARRISGSSEVNKQDGQALIGDLAHERIDLLLGADVDAARRIEAEQGLEPGRDPAGDDDLLHVAAAEASHFRGGAGVDLQFPHRRVDPASLLAHRNGAPGAQSAERGQRHVLLHRALRQERHEPVGRDQDEPGADRVGRMAQLEHAPFRSHLSGVGAPHARDAIEQLLLALALRAPRLRALRRD